MSQESRQVSILTIAGSDSGGGAGIQADLKTFAAHGIHGLSAIAALTAQNTRGVTAIHLPPPPFLRAQVNACFADFDIRAVKIGMLANAELIVTVAELLRQYAPAHVVLDPVMVASSGATLLDPAALDALRRHLLPLATVLTPNIPEAELLVGKPIGDDAGAEEALADLLAMDCRAVLLKGGHLPGEIVTDRLGEGTRRTRFVHNRLPVSGHGTGCTLASALAAELCRGAGLADACAAAAGYVHGALRHGYRPGLGAVAVLDHFWRRPPPS